MSLKELKGQGHWPTVLAAFLYFDFSFMVWTMLGPLANEMSDALTVTQNFIMSADDKATLLAVPVLGGAILRVLLGFLVDKIGAKKTALMSQFVVVCGLFYAYIRGEHITYNELLAVAFVLGFAGGSFAVALPQAGQWYPPKLQGVVLGLAGAGNIGVVIDFIFAPKIAEIWGWQSVFLVGAVLGAAAGFAAGSLLVDDDLLDDVKKKIKVNEKLQDLKKKYDNGTEIVKNQLASFPKSVEDDSELKDFDDIVIDDSNNDDDDEEKASDDLNNAEKDDDTASDEGATEE